MPLEYAVSLDPGIETGWCVWSLPAWRIVAAGVAAPRDRSATWEVRAREVWAGLRRVFFRTGRCRVVYSEWPEFYDNCGGHVTARNGDLIKLTAMAGLGMCLAFQVGAKFVPIPVHTWKGTLPKRVTVSRCQKRLSPAECRLLKTHSWDAAGIGLWAKEHLA